MSRAADLQRHRQTAPDYWEITTKYPEDGDMVDWHDAADVIINLESKIAVSEKRYASLEQQIKRPDLREWMTDKNQRIKGLEADAKVREAKFTEIFDHREVVIDENEKLQAQVKELQEDCRKLADAVVQADGILCNDLYSARVKNAHDILEEVNDIALNRMTEE